MRSVLILCGRYLPGYRDGGPVRSILNLTDRLGDEYDFRILTVDRDHGDTVPYPGIKYNEWNRVGKAKVWYVPPGGFASQLVEEKAAEADVVYVCGCFNDYARVAMRLKKAGRITAPLVIASMGLFSPGAFHIKYWKKKPYMLLLRALGYFRWIEWSATDAGEAADIRREVGRNAVCHLAQDLPRRVDPQPEPTPRTEQELRVIFLSRISRKKNLSCALEILRDVRARIAFDIYGVREDQTYYEECRKLADRLPSNICVTWHDEVHPDAVPETFSHYQVFLFPTIGENYGHVIYEAMTGGCIPVISDRAPWGRLETEGIGRVIPLEDRAGFVTAIERLAKLPPEELLARQRRAAEYAARCSAEVSCDGYREIFGGVNR